MLMIFISHTVSSKDSKSILVFKKINYSIHFPMDEQYDQAIYKSYILMDAGVIICYNCGYVLPLWCCP